MEDFKKKMSADMNDKEIVYSQAIKAGKRIYYLDVKKNRKDELFLAITESKKVITGEGNDALISFEKHKIFLYKEDLIKFSTGLEQAIAFIVKDDENVISPKESPCNQAIEEKKRTTEEKENAQTDCIGSEIKIDIEF